MYTRKNLPEILVYQIMWFFWRSYRGCKNCILPWKSIWADIIDWFWRNIFCQFFSVSFFLGQGQNTSGKKPYRNPVNGNSSKVRRNTSPRERWKNYAKTQADLHLKRQSWHVSWYLQFNHSKQRERFEDIKK